MASKRIGGYLGACALVLALAGPAAAAAGEGIQLGPALLFPTISVTQTYDDNIGLVSGNEESDSVTSIAPALRLVVPVRRFYFEADGGLDILMYQDYDSEDATNWYIGAAVGADFPGGLSFKIADTHVARYLVGSQEYGPGEDTTLNTLKATVGYAVRETLRLEFTALRGAYTYDDSLDRERAETSFQADLYWKFRPRISAIFEAAFASYAYDSNTAQDGGATQVALGLSWDVTAKSTGFAKIGYQWKRYEDESEALGTVSDEYYTLSAGLRHFFTRRTMAQLDLGRLSQESDFPENPYFLRTTVGASLSQRFTAKFYGRAAVRYGLDDYPREATYTNPYEPDAVAQTADRSDRLLSGNLAVGFDATRWLAFELAYGTERRNSNFDTFDYTATRVSLSAKAAF